MQRFANCRLQNTHEIVLVRTKRKLTSHEYEIVVYLYVGTARVYMMPPYFWQTSIVMTPFACGAAMGAFNAVLRTHADSCWRTNQKLVIELPQHDTMRRL